MSFCTVHSLMSRFSSFSFWSIGRRSFWAESACRIASSGLAIVSGSQDRETAHKGVINRHQSARVVKFTAVVGSTEHGHKLTAAEELVAVLNNLMGSADKVDVVLFQKLLDHGLAESVRDAAIVFAPAWLTLFWVRPEQVAKQTVLRNLSGSSDLLQLSHSH